MKIKASVGDQSLEVAPYMVCEIGTDCPEGETPTSPSVKTTPFTWRSRSGLSKRVAHSDNL